MTTPQIDKKKLKLALLMGLDRVILREVLKRNKTKLALAGARADNLPMTPSKAADFVVGLPEKAFDVLRHAMQPLLERPSDSAEQAVAACQRFEGATNVSDADDERKAYTSLLWHLGSEPVPTAILQYLAKHSAAKPTREPVDTAVKSSQDTKDHSHNIDAHGIAAFALDPSGTMPLPQREALALVGALVATRCGRPEIADSFCRVAATHYLDTEELVRRVGEELRTPRKAGGLHSVAAQTVELADDLIPEELDLVARCSKILDTGQRFLDVVGFRGDGQLSVLSEDQAKQLLPESGDIVAFPAAGIARLPAAGEIAVFRVQYKESPGRTKYRVVSVLNAVFEVVEVPLASTDVDKFHAWISSNYLGAPVTRPLFHFIDDVLIKLPVEADSFAKHPGECRADVFTNIRAFTWTGRKFVVDPLPSATGKIDLSAIDALIKSVLKRHIADKQIPGGLNKTAIQEIAAATRSLPTDEVTEEQRERIVNAMEAVAGSKEAMDDIVELLLAEPKIAESIEGRKKELLAAMATESGAVSEEIAKLKRERERLDANLKKAQEEGKRRAKDIAKSVKTAFLEAKANAGSSLAEAALFDEILTRRDTPHRNDGVPAAEVTRGFRLSPNPSEPSKMLVEIGFPRPTSRHLANVIVAARKVGYVLAFRGAACNFVSVELGQALSNTGVYVTEIDPGLTTSNYSREIFAGAGDCDVLLFRNANCSPAEVVLADVIDVSISRGALGTPHALAPHGPLIIATLPSGPLALPLSAALLGVSMVIDLDTLLEEEATEGGVDFLEDVKERALKAGLRPHLWLKMLDRLVKEVGSIEDADRAVALGMIERFVVQPFLSVTRTT